MSISSVNAGEQSKNYDILAMSFFSVPKKHQTQIMNYKLLPLLFFIFPGLVGAESEIFKLNGKPVPAVVAKVNGCLLYTSDAADE